MLMGIDIEGISIIVFVRVLNMLHYVVQGKSFSFIYFCQCSTLCLGYFIHISQYPLPFHTQKLVVYGKTCLFFNALTSWGAIVFSLITAGRGWGLIFSSWNCFFILFLSCVLSFNFLLWLQQVKQFVVMWWGWIKPILVFCLAQVEQYLYQSVHVL